MDPWTKATLAISQPRRLSLGGNRVTAARKIKLTHPGKILREEFIEPIGLTAYALAKALGCPAASRK
jgi:hypothetical protein